MEQLAAHLRGFIVATDEYRRAMAASAGIGVTEAAALGEVLHNGSLSPSGLIKRLGIASASVTALVDRLETANLIQRSPNPADRRGILLTLTPHGRGLIEAMYALFTDDIRAAIEDAEPEHVREFTVALERMQATLRTRAANRDALGEALRQQYTPTGSPDS